VDWDKKASAAFHTKSSKRPLFVTFCMEDYKSLGTIAALPQWPVRLCCQAKKFKMSSKFNMTCIFDFLLSGFT
jgi:hypothetical protein